MTYPLLIELPTPEEFCRALHNEIEFPEEMQRHYDFYLETQELEDGAAWDLKSYQDSADHENWDNLSDRVKQSDMKAAEAILGVLLGFKSSIQLKDIV